MGTNDALSLVVFDVDGTLVDSEQDGHRVAFNEAFAEAGLSYRWDRRTYTGLLRVTGGRRRLHAYLRDQGEARPEALAADLHRTKTKRVTALAAEGRIPLRSGAHELVEDLLRNGRAVAIATTGSRDWVVPLLEHHFGAGVFDPVVTGTEVSELKPAPDAYLAVLDRTGVPRRRAIAVEDSAHGLRAARRAGLACVVARNDETHDQDFSDAALVVDSLSRLSDARLRRIAARTEPASGRPAAGRPPLPGWPDG